MQKKLKQGINFKKAVDNSLVQSLSYQLDRKQIEQLKTVSQVIMAIVGAMGIVSLGLVAPNALKVLKFCHQFKGKFNNLASDEKRKKLEKSFYYLRNNELLKFKNEGGEIKVFLSDKSKELLKKMNFRTMKVSKAKKWDGKWWLVAGDIPTKEHRLGADKFRQKLKDMGFYPLQRTLWVFPFDPRKEIMFISGMFGISGFITVMEINRMETEDENNIKKHFLL